MKRRALSRRTVVGNGIASLAAAMLGCGKDEPPSGTDGGPGEAGRPDAAEPDAGAPDTGEPELDADMIAPDPDFPVRELPAPPMLRSRIAEIGPLQAADANGIRLPEGFTSRVVARTGLRVSGSDYRWHPDPDGGACYPTEDGGWIYVSNSELSLLGGAGAIRFDATGELIAAHDILTLTSRNCAGGITPWHTWLSCEEHSMGRVHECDPWGEHRAIVRPALGRFTHEAAAVDPMTWNVYLSEDESDGRFYRFVPARLNSAGFPDLSAGRLEAAELDRDGNVTWHEISDPELAMGTPTREQVSQTSEFNGGEGLWYHDRVIYLSTKGDTKVWAYHIDDEQMEVIYDGRVVASPPLTGVDNVTVSCCGDVLVAEDGGRMQIVAILPSGELLPVIQIVGQSSSEVTGPAFDPSGTRLYFSSQRGSSGSGITYEVTGPFHELA